MGAAETAEERWLARYRAEERATYPRSEHTVDVALFTIRSGALQVLLVRRGEHPAKGALALPGGFVRLGDGNAGEGEDLDQAARRELAEETGVSSFPGYLEQLRTYSAPARDPRGRVFSTAYVALAPDLGDPRPGADAAEALFVPVAEALATRLAFDHDEILRDALQRVRDKIEYEGRLAASFLPAPFTIPALCRVYEAVWGGRVHRADFRRKVLSAGGFLVATGESDTSTGGPPAALYRLGEATRLHPPMLAASLLQES